MVLGFATVHAPVTECYPELHPTSSSSNFSVHPGISLSSTASVLDDICVGLYFATNLAHNIDVLEYWL